jgi:hypothetical protein
MQITPVPARSVTSDVVAVVERADHRIEQAYSLHGPVFGRVVRAARSDAKRAVELLNAEPDPALVRPVLDLLAVAVTQLTSAALAGEPSVWLDRGGDAIIGALELLRDLGVGSK